MMKPSHVASLAIAASFTFVAAIFAAAPAHKEGAHPHWSYEGATGPEHWGALDASFATCQVGHVQSPIDIPAASLKPEPLDPIRFDYKATPLHVTDNGHTLMATYAPGSTIHIGAAEYELQQVHFHRPSEEKVDGKAFAMVAHLVHKNKEGRLAVVAVLFQEGAANPALDAIFGAKPPAGASLDAASLLPGKTSYFTFEGSLTTPPCTEGVTWYVLRQPMTASANQIAAFAKHYPHNARPVQPLQGRAIHASLEP